MKKPRQRTRPETVRPSMFWLLAGVLTPVLFCVAKFRVRNVKKIPPQGAFVCAMNHYSKIDPIVMGVLLWQLGRNPHFFAKESLFSIPVVGRLLRMSGQIPVKRGGGLGDSLTSATTLLSSGKMLVVYPEGTLTRDPDIWPMRGKTGAVRIALEHNIPVIPIAHWGTQNLMGRYSKKISFFPRKTIDVLVGDPVDLSSFINQPRDTATLNAATEVVMESITRLLEELRHEKAPAKRWNPADHQQKETGRFDA